MTNVRGWLAAAVVCSVVTQFLVTALPARGGVIVATAPLVVIAAYAVTGHIRQARSSRGRTRAGWLMAGLAAGLWSLSNLMYLGYTIVGVTPPDPNLGELASLLAVVLAPPAMLLSSPGTGAFAVRLRRAIDVTVILGALMLISWQVVLRGVVTVLDPSIIWLVLALPALELLAGALAVVILARSVTMVGDALSMLAWSMLGFGVVNLLYIANATYGRPVYSLGCGGGYVFATALTAIASRSPLPPPGTLESEQMSGRSVLLPYVPVGLALAVAAVTHVRGGLGPVEVWLLLATAALVLLRQLLSARTNQALLRDVTEQRAQLAHLAYHDALTGLANRTLLAQRAAAAVAAAGPDALTAVVLLDLDGFKQVNDTLGHAAGDQLLIATADRLQACTREADTVARLGGDEFVLLLPALSSAHQADELATRVLTALAAPLTIAGTALRIRATGGIALTQTPTTTLDALLRDADLALYQAKAAGKGRISRRTRTATATR